MRAHAQGERPSASAFIHAPLTPRRGCTHRLQPCIQVGEQWDTLNLSAELGGRFEDHTAPFKGFFFCVSGSKSAGLCIIGAKLCLSCLLLLLGGRFLSSPFIQLEVLGFRLLCICHLSCK